MNKAQEAYIERLNILASGADLDNVPYISEAKTCVKDWNLDGTLAALNKIEEGDTSWHEELLEIYCDIRAEGR